MAPRKRRREKGSGSVYRRKDGKWEAALTIQGKLRRRVAAHESAAKAKLAELIKQRDAGVDIDDGAQTVAQWFQIYYDRQQRLELKPRSLDSERDLIERYLLPRLGTLRLDKLTSGDIQVALDDIRDDIAAHTRYDGVRTTHMCAAVIRRMCNLAVRRHALIHTPYNDIILPKPTAQGVKPLDDKPLQELLGVAAPHRLAALWFTYALLGLRRNEALGLMWADVDFEHRTLLVRRQLAEDNGQLIPRESTKNDVVRLLPLIDPLPALYQARWEAQLLERQQAGPNWQEQGLMFATATGNPLWPHNIGRTFRALRAEAGVSITIHGLRHGVATMLAEVPVSELIIAAVLGHGEHSITSRYTHPRVGAMRQALDAVAQRIDAVTLAQKKPEKKDEQTKNTGS